MQLVHASEMKEFIPSRFNMELAKAKGLASNEKWNDKYFQVLSLYYYGLNFLLNKTVNLVSAENLLKKNGIRPVKKKKRDVYHKLALNEFFFLRNTLYVEKLSSDDIDKILSYSKEGDLLEVVKRTFKDVIVSEIKSATPMAEFEIAYGELSPSYFAMNNDLVIGIRVQETKQGLFQSDEAWFNKYRNERRLIEKVKKELQRALCTKLNMSCKVLEYDDTSYIKEQIMVPL